MKTVQTSFIRAIIAVVVGLLLIKYREETVTWITIIIGVLFFISGLISCIVYLVNRNAKPTAVVDVEGRPISLNKPTFPVVGIGSLVLGVALAAFPNLVVNWMVYILGAILIFGAVGQSVNRCPFLPSLTFGWATISQSMAVLPALPVLEKNAAPVRSFGGDLLMFAQVGKFL